MSQPVIGTGIERTDDVIILRQVIVDRVGEQQSGHSPEPSGTGGMVSMAFLMLAMCVGMAVAVSVASAIGGPVAWVLAVSVIVGLAFAHLKFMNHGGH